MEETVKYLMATSVVVKAPLGINRTTEDRSGSWSET